jgi:hypothetical protein
MMTVPANTTVMGQAAQVLFKATGKIIIKRLENCL